MGLDMYLYKRKKLNEEEEKELKIQEKIYQEASKKLEEIMTPIYDKYKDKLKNYFSEERKKAQEDYQEELKNTSSYKMQKNIKEKANKRIEEIKSETEIGYWRKHADLHGYMEDLYIERGGREEFNCVEIDLYKEDCEEIIAFARERLEENEDEVEHTTGFFFGQTQKEDWEETIKIFENALNTVNFDTEEIYYNSWW